MESSGRLHDVGERAGAFKLDKTVSHVIYSFGKSSTIQLTGGRHFRECYGTQPILQETSSPTTGVNPDNQVSTMRCHPPPQPQTMQVSWIN